MSSKSILASYDILGIGFGPSNIAVAIALEESKSALNVHFIESAGDSTWQPGMLLDGSDIQNNPLRDLVTLRNPQSTYTFINYLKTEGRLIDFLNLGVTYPFRKDYAKYILWVAKFFANQVSYNMPALKIEHDGFCGWLVTTPRGILHARALLLGIGRSRHIPEAFESILGSRVFHLCDYLPRLRSLGKDIKSVAVIGGSQSAVEINLDLMGRYPNLAIHAVHRGYSMRQKDTSPFSDHVYFPEFVDYFFGMDNEARADLQRQLRSTNYSAADLDVLHRLYTTLYEERLDGRQRFEIHSNTIVRNARTSVGQVLLDLKERFRDRDYILSVDAVVLATGFKDIGVGEGKESCPPLLSQIADRCRRSQDGALQVQRDYSLTVEGGGLIYLNGLCESSHGLGDAGSFSLLSLRSLDIVRSCERKLGNPSGDVAPVSMRQGAHHAHRECPLVFSEPSSASAL